MSFVSSIYLPISKTLVMQRLCGAYFFCEKNIGNQFLLKSQNRYQKKLQGFFNEKNLQSFEFERQHNLENKKVFELFFVIICCIFSFEIYVRGLGCFVE